MGGVMYGDASRASGTASLPITLIASLFGAGHVGRSGLSCGAPNSPPVAAACDTLCCSCASRRAYASCDRSTILENYYSGRSESTMLGSQLHRACAGCMYTPLGLSAARCLQIQ